MPNLSYLRIVYLRPNTVVQQLLPMVPAFFTGAGSSPGCSSFSPAPCQCTWDSSEGWPKSHMGDLEKAPGSRFRSTQAWPLQPFGE